MSNAETKTLPTHRIYSVMSNGENKATWTEIGAAFEHRDRKGFNLVFAARPLEGAQIVLRQPRQEIEPKAKTPAGSRRTRGRYDAVNAVASEASAQ